MENNNNVLSRIYIYALVLSFLFFFQESFASGIFYQSTRGLGMGGAQISAVNDETSVLVNPAALGKIRGGYFSALDFDLEMSPDTYELIGADILRGLDPQTILDDLNADPNKVYHLRAQSLISYARRNFSIGLFGNYTVDANINTNNPLPFEMSYRNDLAVVMGFNKRFKEGRIKIGGNLRLVNRVEIEDNFLTNSNLSVGANGREGIGLGSDIGIQVAAPWKYLPTLSAVLRDVGGTHYTLKEGLFNGGSNSPEKTSTSLDVGFALFPIRSNYSRFTFTGEYRDVLSSSDLKNSLSKYHLGFEWNSFDRFFLRAGLNQGYWTAGLEYAFSKFQIQLASYGQEVGDTIESKESRSYLLKFTVRF